SRLAPELVASLEAIGCPPHAGIASRAIAALNLKGRLDSDAIETALTDGGEQLSAALSRCDEDFYAESGEDIAGQLFAFIRRRSIASPQWAGPDDPTSTTSRALPRSKSEWSCSRPRAAPRLSAKQRRKHASTPGRIPMRIGTVSESSPDFYWA